MVAAASAIGSGGLFQEQPAKSYDLTVQGQLMFPDVSRKNPPFYLLTGLEQPLLVFIRSLILHATGNLQHDGTGASATSNRTRRTMRLRPLAWCGAQSDPQMNRRM